MAELRRVGLLGDDRDENDGDGADGADGADDGDGADVDAVVLALHRYLGRTPSRLLALSLADAVGEVRTQNQPGTTDEYPNWRVPLGGPDGRQVLLEGLFTDARAAALCEAMRNSVEPRR